MGVMMHIVNNSSLTSHHTTEVTCHCSAKRWEGGGWVAGIEI